MWVSGAGIPKVLGFAEGLKGIEIGMSAGVTTRHFFELLPGLQMVEIDPYAPYVDWNGDEHTPYRAEATLEEFWIRNADFKSRIRHFHTTSDKAAKFLPDEAFDFVFIDGLHTYDQVLKDCQNYWPKVKSGGLFAGHDFNTIQAVGDAVRAFAKSLNAHILQTEHDVWYWRKP